MKFFGVIFTDQCNSFAVLHNNITVNWYWNFISRSLSMRHSMLKFAVFPCQLPTWLQTTDVWSWLTITGKEMHKTWQKTKIADSRFQLKCDGTRWRTEGEVKGKLANGVGSQYSLLPRNLVYPVLLPQMRTPRLPVVEWADAHADLNGLVRFAERQNLFSARVPSHFTRSLLVLSGCDLRSCGATSEVNSQVSSQTALAFTAIQWYCLSTS